MAGHKSALAPLEIWRQINIKKRWWNEENQMDCALTAEAR